VIQVPEPSKRPHAGRFDLRLRPPKRRGPFCLHTLLAASILGVVALLAPGTAALAVMAGGEPDTPANRVDPNFAASNWASVGSVVRNGVPYSGVLITRRHVLTAAHVAGDDPAKLAFVLNAGGDASHQLAVKAIHRHPEWKGFDPKRPNDDLAILELGEAAPADIAIHPIVSGGLRRGMEFTVVGYGASGNGDVGTTVSSTATVKRVGRNTVDKLIPDETVPERIEGFIFDFDGGGHNVMGGEGLGNDVETTFAGGDSGSPSFIHAPGGWALFGVNTFIMAFPDGPTKPSTFGTGGGGMIVAAYKEWIEQVVRSTMPAAHRDAALLRWVPGDATGVPCVVAGQSHDAVCADPTTEHHAKMPRRP
jgi:hypothetical protein